MGNAGSGASGSNEVSPKGSAKVYKRINLDELRQRYKWVLENRVAKNIDAVISTGPILVNFHINLLKENNYGLLKICDEFYPNYHTKKFIVRNLFFYCKIPIVDPYDLQMKKCMLGLTKEQYDLFWD